MHAAYMALRSLPAGPPSVGKARQASSRASPANITIGLLTGLLRAVLAEQGSHPLRRRK